MEDMICKCEGTIEGKLIRNVVWYWDTGWTQFILFKCQKCGKYYGFPHQNFKLAIKHGWTIDKQ